MYHTWILWVWLLLKWLQLFLLTFWPLSTQEVRILHKQLQLWIATRCVTGVWPFYDQVMLTWTMKMNWPRPYWPMPNAMWRRTLSEARNGGQRWMNLRAGAPLRNEHQLIRQKDDRKMLPLKKSTRKTAVFHFPYFLVQGASNFPWISF